MVLTHFYSFKIRSELKDGKGSGEHGQTVLEPFFSGLEERERSTIVNKLKKPMGAPHTPSI